MLKLAENQAVIRKYANRRLYDTSASRYVTIDDLCMMVKDNIDFRVVDANKRTGYNQDYLGSDNSGN